METEFKPISDMYLAAAFLAYGAELDHVDKSDKKRQNFIFVGKIDKILVYTDNGFYLIMNEPKFEEVKAKYDSNRLFFPPSYPDAVRKIKSAIHS